MCKVMPGTRLSIGTGEIRVANPLIGKQLRVSARAARALVAWGTERAGELPEPHRERLQPLLEAVAAVPVDERTQAGIDHWVERGWEVCLDYYLASRGTVHADRADRAEQPPPPRRDVTGERIPLPPPGTLPDRSLGEVLMKRRSVRRYRPGATGSAQLSQLLAHGLAPCRRLRAATEPNQPPDPFLNDVGVAFDFYLACYDIAGVERGSYFYDLARHALVRVGDIPALEQEEWFWGMPGPRTAAGSVVLVADFAQSYYRYAHERALRDLYLAAGQIAQRLVVVAGYCDLGTLVTPAVRDRLINRRLQLDPAREAVTYTVTFGVDARRSASAPEDS